MILADTTRHSIVAEARKYIGVPFMHKGRDITGIDCVGLIYMAFYKFIQIPDPRGYSKHVTSFQSFMIIREYADRISRQDAGPGDIVIMCTHGNSAHYGLLADDTIIYADRIAGKVIEHSLSGIIDTDSKDKRIVAYFRMRGLAPWATPLHI